MFYIFDSGGNALHRRLMIGWGQIATILAALASKCFLWSHALTAVIIMSISHDLACSFMDGSKDYHI